MMRTRVAPSPTGEYHIGGVRTLLYNYALAKKTGGQVILRIEDTDRERHVEGATERLMHVIKDYGLDWDEGPGIGGPYAPYVQSERLDIYKKHALQLVESGHAYYCFCSKERLAQLKAEQTAKGMPATKYDKRCLALSKAEIEQKLKSNAPYVIRLNVPKNEEISFEDKVLGRVSFFTNDIDDQVLLKSDGFPTYHLAVVVDDYLMKITFVMRGIEWLPSTPKHILLYRAFGWELPNYAHLPVLKEKGATRKLSKRKDSAAAAEFLAQGYLPEAVLNFLMFLGWNPGTQKEIYSLAGFIEDFSVERVHKTDMVVFDRDKLLWTNGVYIRKLTSPEFYAKVVAWAKKYNVDLKTGNADGEYVARVYALIQERVKVLAEVPELTFYFFALPKVDVAKIAGKVLAEFMVIADACAAQSWDVGTVEAFSRELMKKNGYEAKAFLMTLRYAVCGVAVTPPLYDTFAVLGKERVVARLKRALELV